MDMKNDKLDINGTGRLRIGEMPWTIPLMKIFRFWTWISGSEYISVSSGDARPEPPMDLQAAEKRLEE